MCGVWPEITDDDYVVDESESDIPALAEFRLTERALRDIRNGTYGRCETCDGEIAGERLEVLPFATICIKCQLSPTLDANND